jgi:tetratricopeptide (TPR) repeat protein
MRPALLLIALTCVPACVPKPLVGMSRLETSRVLMDDERYDGAAEMAEWLLTEPQDPPLNAGDEAEAAWVAGESRFVLGDHKLAYRHFKRLLESAPWSPHVAALESRLYEIGLALLYEDQYDGWIFNDRGRGIEVMTTLQVHFRQSDRADDALRHIADWFASEEQEEWLEAALTYEQLWIQYRDSEWAEKALSEAARCRLKRVYGPTYNPCDLDTAHLILREVVRRYPRGSAARTARETLADTREMLAASHLLAADFYAARERPEGVGVRLAYAAWDYPDTVAGQAALQRMADLGLDLEQIMGELSLEESFRRINPCNMWELEQSEGGGIRAQLSVTYGRRAP